MAFVARNGRVYDTNGGPNQRTEIAVVTCSPHGRGRSDIDAEQAMAEVCAAALNKAGAKLWAVA